MTESKIETAKGYCVVALTKYLMERFQELPEDAFRRLLGMELYQLLMDEDTRLFLETNEFLCKCCDMELEYGINGLYNFIDSSTNL